ncbi:MAG: type IV toxin-antitoxin system AbiEi family antitoxin domain-containing protein [bacterium]
MSLTTFFDEQPVFTREQAQRRLAAGTGNKRSPRTVDSLLTYHLRQGRVLRVRRGLYVAVPRGISAEHFSPDPYLVAAKAATDAVLSYHTALELRGRAYSIFATYYFLTEYATRPFHFRGIRFQPVSLPKSLRTPRRRSLGVDNVDHGGVTIKVTSLERTLVDILDRIDLAGGWEEAWRSLELVEYFDIDAVIKYVLALGNATTVAKVGYFLEEHRQKLMVEPKHFKKLERARPKQPCYLQSKSADNVFARRWNLIVPRWLAERHWEEA